MDATISELGRPEDTPTFNGAMPKVQVHTNVGRTFRSAIADFFDVYPLGREQSPVILAAMKLLQEARNTLDEAYRYRDMDDVVNADDCLLRLRASAPRTLSLPVNWRWARFSRVGNSSQSGECARAAV